MPTRDLAGEALSFSVAQLLGRRLVRIGDHARDIARRLGVGGPNVEAYFNRQPDDENRWMQLDGHGNLDAIPAFASNQNLAMPLIAQAQVRVERSGPGARAASAGNECECEGADYLQAGLRCLLLIKVGEHVLLPLSIANQQQPAGREEHLQGLERAR